MQQQLWIDVWTRAQARHWLPGCEFVDSAAELLWRATKAAPSGLPGPNRARLNWLQKQAWVDNCVLQVFAEHPKGLGVEWQAGLNTRFHRLSARSPWPRFFWCDVDSFTVADVAWRLLPPTDNYQFVAFEAPQATALAQGFATTAEAVVFIADAGSGAFENWPLWCERAMANLPAGLPVYLVCTQTHCLVAPWWRRAFTARRFRQKATELSLRGELLAKVQRPAWGGVFVKLRS